MFRRFYNHPPSNFRCCTTTRTFNGSTLSSVSSSALRHQSNTNSKIIERSTIWALWNEGNLFSLNSSELTQFLESNNVEVPEKAKKTALVRLVEDLMSQENPNAFGNTAANVDTLQSLTRDIDPRTESTGDLWTDTATQTFSGSGAPGGQNASASTADQSSSSSSPPVAVNPRNINIRQVYDESDFYGDWSIVGQNAELAEDGSPLAETLQDRERAAQDDDFVAFHAPSQSKNWHSNQSSQHLAPKAYQFLHEKAVGDFGLANINVTGLPGCHHLAEGSTVSIAEVSANDANKVRFRRAFHWAVSNSWANNREAEINIGAGRCLYWDGAAKESKALLPVWVCQRHLCDAHPYVWFAVAHEESVNAMERLASDLGMTPTASGGSDSSHNNDTSMSSQSVSNNNASNSASAEVSYKLGISGTKLGGFIEAEVNGNFETTHVYRPWQRYLVSHYIRENMPDLRFLVRARSFVSRKDSEPIFRAPILRESGKSVQPILAPEIGDICYCSHREIRRWSTKLGRGTRIMLVETRRTPLITIVPGDDAERVEYELIASVPRPEDNVDISELADELWDQGMFLALRLEESMEDLHSYVMKAATFL